MLAQNTSAVTRPAPQTGRVTRAQLALALALLANAAGQSLLFVMLPGLGRQLGFSDLQTGALLSASALLLILAAPFWGFVSEKTGRRPVLLIALTGITLAPLLFAAIVQGRMAGTLGILAALTLFFLARSAQALVSGGLMPVAQAYMADTTGVAGRAGGMGLLGASYGLGAIVGAAMAWRVGGSQPVLAFMLAAVLAMIGFIALAALVPEPKRRGEAVQLTHAPHPPAHLPLAMLWPFLLITLFAITAYGLLQQVTALRLQDAWGQSAPQATATAGAVMMVTSVVMILSQGIVLRLLRWPATRLLLVGALLATAALLVATLARNPQQLFGAMAVFGGAVGLMLPGNLAALSLRTGVDTQGKAAGLNAMGQGLGMSLGPISGAGLHQFSPALPFAMAGLLLALCTVLALLATRRSALAPLRPSQSEAPS
ncbi:MAG: MFS transporter [Xanthobacter sp.]